VRAPKIDYLGRLLDTDLEVGNCDLLKPTTQQKELFAHRADPSTGKDVPDDEICVYFLYGTIRSRRVAPRVKRPTGFRTAGPPPS
jgi:hypothetical protein